MQRAPRVVAFDIIGTVFSLDVLRERLTAVEVPGHALELWFSRSLRDLFALAAAGVHRPFRDVLDGNLAVVLDHFGAPRGEAARAHILDGFAALEAHPDAGEAFRRLAAAGVRVVALTNGAGPTTETLLKRAGLLDLVEHVVSIDDVGIAKPRREVYHHAAQLAVAPVEEMALVAAHPWDVNGAAEAGLMTAYVARREPYPAFFRKPDVTAPTLDEAVAALIRAGG